MSRSPERGARLRGPTACALAVGVLVALPAPALASFHLVKVREVRPGTASTAYVEVQMYASGQQFTSGAGLTVWDSAGSNASCTSFTSVANGQSQRTVLIGSSSLSGRDLTCAAVGSLDPAGGAVCWRNQLLTITYDCVRWGSFSGSLPSPAGTPAAASGIPGGEALARRIGRHCSTLLEAVDDTNDSAADFALRTPNPRNNSVTPTESACPQARITKGPSGKTKDRTPTFKFTSSPPPPGGFKCKVDDRSYKSCTSPHTLGRLKLGRHTFKVKAVGGNSITTPDVRRFKVIRRR